MVMLAVLRLDDIPNNMIFFLEFLERNSPEMKDFWPEAKGRIHIDAWREVAVVDNFSIEIIAKSSRKYATDNLFFINLGGYKENEFEEYHKN
jgi:hypothetical protein